MPPSPSSAWSAAACATSPAPGSCSPRDASPTRSTPGPSSTTTTLVTRRSSSSPAGYWESAAGCCSRCMERC
ncbi:unnamed protein product [Linum tenue]|uniref:Secreted protein n=1 Tax=Linum tenue TaxID=586396 RepID=A0AAV0H3J6_9ROSI|nr:unnamed protein product [Linum tenue]